LGFLSLYFLYENKFTADFFVLSFNNWALMLILASICTAYALRLRESDEKLSPYTVMLTTNLEPVYGIIFSVFYYWWKRKMSFSFYVGAVIIIITVILNGIIKHKAGKKIVAITDDTITKDVR
jgi:drug/metabolite transporter (DMT)-like permease